MLRPHAQSDQPGRQLAQSGNFHDQLYGQGRLERSCRSQYRCNHAVLDRQLDALDDAGRPFAARLHLRKMFFFQTAFAQDPAKNIRSRHSVLHRDANGPFRSRKAHKDVPRT